MQIVRDLAGYTMGRSDLVRRAMSKKKASVMEKERHNFVYGNPEEGVAGCIANGIDQETADHIYDEMTDFAKYAFNKSHAVCYAVVAYQTAFLKYYYPLEFMAALMTSVMDNGDKTAEYIMTCRQMGISILPPDINEGEGGFSVSGGAIRYGLSAIRSVGRSVVDAIVAEREAHGLFVSMEDFVERMSNKEVNRKTLENFIKSGALDSMPGNRRQKVMVAPELLDKKNKEQKNSMAGQMSLFDFVDEAAKDDFRITLPDVPEYPKEELLAFEKEILGVYISGHPLDAYMELWQKNITATAADFVVDEETDKAKVVDGSTVTIGGMVAGKSVKATRTGQMMAFLTLEDMFGSVEVLVFPKTYESHKSLFVEDEKLFIQGKVSIGDDPVGKLICDQVVPFKDVPRELWVQFEDILAYRAKEQALLAALREKEGRSSVIVYLKKEKAKKVLPANWNVTADEDLLGILCAMLGEKNIRLVEKRIEKRRKMG